MKADGINELVLDLRYNGGGSLETAVGFGRKWLTTVIAEVQCFLDFNNKHNSEDFDYFEQSN